MSSSNTEILPYRSTAAREHLAEGYTRPDTLTVDIHGHMLVPEADALIRPHLPAASLDAVKYAGEASRKVNAQQNIDRANELAGTEERLAEMDRMGIDVMIISPVPPQFNYLADAGLCLEGSQIINDRLAQAVKDHPERLRAIGTVPLQDTDRAISELERCMGELGMLGLEIGANAGTEELSVDRLDPFWARVEELNAPILLHPTSFASDRMGDHYLTNTIGNPLETTVAVHHMIYGGVLERFPGLRIVLSHGGAFAAAYAARMDHAWGARPDCRGRISRPPTSYLKQMYFDSIVFETDQLAFLVGKYGADRVLIGTDYPFDMAEFDPIEHVLQTPGLSAEDQAKICGLNAVELLGLNPAEFGRATAGPLKANR